MTALLALHTLAVALPQTLLTPETALKPAPGATADDLMRYKGRFDDQFGLPYSCLQSTSDALHILGTRQLFPWDKSAPYPSCDRATEQVRTLQAATTLEYSLTAHAARQDCSTPSALIQVRPEDTGWLSMLHGLTKAAMHAVTEGRTLLSPAMRMWTSGEKCSRRDLGCFFAKLARTCDSVVHPDGAGAHEPVHGYDWAWRPVEAESQVEMVMLPDWLTEHENRPALPFAGYDALVPQPYSSLGWFGWSSKILSWLMTPNDEMLATMRERLVQSGFAAAQQSALPVIGMHVRHGDACDDGYRTGRSCSPLADYMRQAEKVRAATGANTIYLATDSADVVREALTNYKDWTFLRQVEPLQWAGLLKQRTQNATVTGTNIKSQVWDNVMRWNWAQGAADDNGKTAFESSLDVYLLSFADIFIGKHTSNFFRTAFELHASRCNCAPPFFSFDAPWCFDWNKAAGISLDGNGAAGERFFC